MFTKMLLHSNLIILFMVLIENPVGTFTFLFVKIILLIVHQENMDKIFNHLPLHVKQYSSLNDFKRLLTELLVDNCFYFVQDYLDHTDY